MRRRRRKIVKPAIVYILSLAVFTGVVAGYGQWRKARALSALEPEITVYYFRTEPAAPALSSHETRVAGD